MPEAPKTWIVTGSPENLDATRGRGFRLIGTLRNERRRNQAAARWRLAFQGRLRTVSDADAALLLDRLRAAAGAPA